MTFYLLLIFSKLSTGKFLICWRTVRLIWAGIHLHSKELFFASKYLHLTCVAWIPDEESWHPSVISLWKICNSINLRLFKIFGNITRNTLQKCVCTFIIHMQYLNLIQISTLCILASVCSHNNLTLQTHLTYYNSIILS